MALTYVQGAANSYYSSAGQTSLTATFTANTTAGNLLVAGFMANVAPSGLTVPSGWTQLTSVTGTTGILYLYYRENCTSVASVQFSWSLPAPLIGELTVGEWSGVATSSSTDGSAVTNTGTTGNPSTGSLTTSNSNDVLVAVYGQISGSGVVTATYSAPTNSFNIRKQTTTDSGFVSPSSNRKSIAGCIADRIVSSSGTFSTGCTVDNQMGWATIIAAFKQSGNQYNETGSGGAVVAGADAEAVAYNPTTSGTGLQLAGASAPTATYALTTSGAGLLAAGTATNTERHNSTADGTGGAMAAGDTNASATATYNEVGNQPDPGNLITPFDAGTGPLVSYGANVQTVSASDGSTNSELPCDCCNPNVHCCYDGDGNFSNTLLVRVDQNGALFHGSFFITATGSEVIDGDTYIVYTGSQYFEVDEPDGSVVSTTLYITFKCGPASILTVDLDPNCSQFVVLFPLTGRCDGSYPCPTCPVSQLWSVPISNGRTISSDPAGGWVCYLPPACSCIACRSCLLLIQIT